MTDRDVTPQGEPAQAPAPSGEHPPTTFGEEAAQMANETEVEATQQQAGLGEDAGDVEFEDDLLVARRDVADLTADLQRLQAEYLNYKRRVERDRELIRENATYAALAPITEVLDTIDRAREHAPIDGGFKAVADQLERIVAARGLTKFGAVGDPFDPTIHEALSHIGEDPDVEVTTCKVIAKAGYRIGDRVVRAAQVLVVDPPSEASEPAGPVASAEQTEQTEPVEQTDPVEQTGPAESAQ